MLETGMMVVKRIALDPVKFRLIRMIKFRLKVQAAQRSGAAVPVNTPELEAVGLMSDMLSLMYRYSVDTLGAVIAPITIVVLFLFREEFEVASLYAMRASDLRFFMLFSFFIIPALWIIDIFLFNLEELLWSWKLFEYIQFCHERFRNRSRRWVGLDTTINEELPPDLRAMDQMCLSIQFFMLGALHASGIVMAVLGYMLVLHKSHNVFGDPMVMPIFFAMLMAFNVGKRVVLKIADRFQIWMVEGEREYEEVYDEGPGSRNQGALPPGMAAIDASLAECIEDAFSVGYTDETLSKLLTEAISYIPPGSSIQVAGTSVADDTTTQINRMCNVGISSEQWHVMQRQAQSLFSSAEGMPSARQVTSRAAAINPALATTVGGTPVSASMYLATGRLPVYQDPQSCFGSRSVGLSGALVAPTFSGPTNAVPPVENAPSIHRPTSHALSEVVPTVPGRATPSCEGEATFSEFMAAFRTEMRQSRDLSERMQKFVPSSKMQDNNWALVQQSANKIFGRSMESGMSASVENNLGTEDLLDFDEWPDEFLLLGVAEQDAEAGSSPSSESEISTTTETGSTEETAETDNDDENAWPIEMLIG
jgi:hypothetical protein